METQRKTDSEWAAALLAKLVAEAELMAAVVLAWLREMDEL
jgi:hypothetical protein